MFYKKLKKTTRTTKNILLMWIEQIKNTKISFISLAIVLNFLFFKQLLNKNSFICVCGIQMFASSLFLIHQRNYKGHVLVDNNFMLF